MYDYEYERDALLALRLLKFLYRQDPDALHRLLKTFKRVDIDELIQCAELSTWEIFSNVIVTIDPEWDADIAIFSHPIIDRFYDVGNRWCATQGIGRSAWRKKAADVMNYFIGSIPYGVSDLDFTFSETHITLRVRFSPDCPEPLIFGSTMVDMLLYMEQELQRMEALILQTRTETNDRKAAA